MICFSFRVVFVRMILEFWDNFGYFGSDLGKFSGDSMIERYFLRHFMMWKLHETPMKCIMGSTNFVLECASTPQGR